MNRLSYNPIVYSMIEERIFEEQAAESGYKRISTFYADLSIAEWFVLAGTEPDAIRDTFNRVCESWISDFKMFTEFILSLNWKSWEFYDENDEIGALYSDLYYEAVNLFLETYKDNDDALSYYYRVTD